MEKMLKINWFGNGQPADPILEGGQIVKVMI